MTQPLSTTQINQYIKDIKAGGVNQAIAVYTTLLGEGHNYASWARGVARGDTFTGRAALDFLQGTALIGLDKDAEKWGQF